MSGVIGLISCNYGLNELQSLVMSRPVASVPFGGRYRLIDFALSSMVNSGMRSVGVVTPANNRSILDHLGAGKEWALDRKAGGLFIMPGAHRALLPRNNKFSLKDMRMNIEFLESASGDEIVVSACNYVYNMDFQAILEQHKSCGSDITLVCKAYRSQQLSQLQKAKQNLVVVDEEKRVWGMLTPETLKDERETEDSMFESDFREDLRIFCDIFVISRRLLLHMVKAYEDSEFVDIMDVIGENVRQLKVSCFMYNGFIKPVYSLDSYFDLNMELLEPAVRGQLFQPDYTIKTKIKDNPAAHYGPQSSVSCSLVSSGCQIEGQLENSILSREVRVEIGAVIRNSIIMQKCTIGSYAVLDHVILDKMGNIHSGTVLNGKRESLVVMGKAAVI